MICFREEGGNGGGGKRIWDEEISVLFVGSELLGGELCRYGRAFERRRHM